MFGFHIGFYDMDISNAPFFWWTPLRPLLEAIYSTYRLEDRFSDVESVAILLMLWSQSQHTVAACFSRGCHTK